MRISARLVDCMHGVPACGVGVRLDRQAPDGWVTEATAVTDGSGRVQTWAEPVGGEARRRYRLVFDLARYFAEVGVATVHPEIVVCLAAFETAAGYHVDVAAAATGYAVVATGGD